MSSLLSEEDLNDFISPGLACIKPVEISRKSDGDKNEQSIDNLEVTLEDHEETKVSITLQDCLACVGCITSSEEILLSRQSETVFLNDWNAKRESGESWILAVSISPQSRVSIAEYFQIEDIVSFDYKLMKFLEQKFDCKYVVGTQYGRQISIEETSKHVINYSGSKKPRLCSACPGLVLYAEKSKPELVPHLVTIKSPQQLTGQLLKQQFGKQGKLYHLTIMPCFDKKLEASRQENENEVDCVITPKEFVKLLTDNSWTDFFKNIPVSPDQNQIENLFSMMSPPGWLYNEHMAVNKGSSSGGYATEYLEYIRQKKGLELTTQIQEFHSSKNDTIEYKLIDDSGTVIARSSQVYGFKNIQNLVRNIKKTPVQRKLLLKKRTTTSSSKQNSNNLLTNSPFDTDFIEVMACPKGCINGGGLLQTKQSQPLQERYETINQVPSDFGAEQKHSAEIKSEVTFVAQVSDPTASVPSASAPSW